MSQETLAIELQALIDQHGQSAVACMLGDLAGISALDRIAEAMYYRVALELARAPSLDC